MKPKRSVIKTVLILGLSLGAIIASQGCTRQSAQGRLALADKLFLEAKYEAAVGEFERVVSKDPGGSAGLIALRKAAEIQTVYLSQHQEAIKKLKTLLELVGPGDQNWVTKKEIARIYFEKTEQFEQALASYRELLAERTEGSEAPGFLYRIAKSQFYLWRFEAAIKTFNEIVNGFSSAPESELAAYEIGVTYLTAGERIAGSHGLAKVAFEDFIKKYPQSKKTVEARFGIANCLEEMEQFAEAQALYEQVRDQYPSPNVVKIRLIRLQERLSQKKGKNEKSK